MTRKSYSNEQLAQDYISVCSVGTGDNTQYRIRRRKIEQCEVNLFDFYNEQNGSLQELTIRGIGTQTKSMLELILRHGVKKVSEERQKDFERSFHVTRPHKKFHPDAGQDDFNFDRAIKKYERD